MQNVSNCCRARGDSRGDSELGNLSIKDVCRTLSLSRLIERRYSLAGAGSECDKNFLSTLCSCVLMMLLMVVAAPQSHKPHFKCKAATTTTSRTTLAASATTTHTHSYTHTHIDTTWSSFNKLLPKNTWHSHESLLFISCSSWSSLSLPLRKAAKYMNLQSWIYSLGATSSPVNPTNELSALCEYVKIEIQLILKTENN